MDKREFKVGDRVWSLINGFGTVKDIVLEVESEYPVKVVFDSGIRTTYTADGFWHTNHKTPSLFHANQGKIEFDTDEPIELEDGQPIWVRDSERNVWRPRHFKCRSEKGGVYCYCDGKSKHGTAGEGSTMRWKLFRTTDPALDGAGQ